MYVIRPPRLYRWLFKEAIFRKDPNEKIIYLTFDDGPDPEATPFVLAILQEHKVKATFFVLGKNAVEHPDIMNEIRRQGHVIGNHGMNHKNGWATNKNEYLEDVMEGKKISGSSLFRPPYGKLSVSQYQSLKDSENIIFWDVISGDFDQSIDATKVVSNVVDNTRNGSVIVMHDSKKAMNNLKDSMNEIIVRLTEKGYEFGVLSTSNERQY